MRSTCKGETRSQKQKEMRKQKELAIQEWNVAFNTYSQLKDQENLEPWEAEMLSDAINYLRTYRKS